MTGVNSLIIVTVVFLLQEKGQADVLSEKLAIVTVLNRPVVRLAHIDLENQTCQTDADCAQYLPSLDLALSIVSTVPSAPYCSDIDDTNSTASRRCTCGDGKCVSYTREFGKGTILYYCGPCSHVGAQCEMKDTCQHEMAECRDNYCMCKNDGDFYEFSFCEIPYIGYEMTLQIAIIVCIVIAMCLLLASVYSIINVRRLRDLRELARQRRGRRADSEMGESQTISEDSPPVYDEVVGNLPSYQDALAMTEVPSSTVVGETQRDDTAEATASRDRASDQESNTSSAGSPREPDNEVDDAEGHRTEHQTHIQQALDTTLVVRGNGHSETLQEQSSEGSRPQESEDENDPEEVISSVSRLRESQSIQTRF
ncbi:uncharacterized protein LOC125035368 isoform X2 [Penaeus chinensis]|uniref:uncharacterized protein LOC125035368 isoform X2 n=1 Tax=Penaeus chinensis TaxID=139456 RepID=UPI001FB73BD1|nr:uncharacterized protein LOC125035368 isoform X2 [Penaeus chinensis]